MKVFLYILFFIISSVAKAQDYRCRKLIPTNYGGGWRSNDYCIRNKLPSPETEPWAIELVLDPKNKKCSFKDVKEKKECSLYYDSHDKLILINDFMFDALAIMLPCDDSNRFYGMYKKTAGEFGGMEDLLIDD